MRILTRTATWYFRWRAGKKNERQKTTRRWWHLMWGRDDGRCCRERQRSAGALLLEDEDGGLCLLLANTLAFVFSSKLNLDICGCAANDPGGDIHHRLEFMLSFATSEFPFYLPTLLPSSCPVRLPGVFLFLSTPLFSHARVAYFLQRPFTHLLSLLWLLIRFLSLPKKTNQQDGSKTLMKREGIKGFFWKLSRIGERLSPYVGAGCATMAVYILFFK